MKAEREDIEKFDAYLFGEMNEEEQLLFESKLATDEEYAAEFAVHKLLAEALSDEKEARFREILQQQRTDTFIGNNTWGKKFTLISAAVVLLGALVLVFSIYREHNPIRNLAKRTNEAAANPADEPKLDNSPFLQEEANAANESEAYGYDDNLSSTPEVEEIEDGSDLEAFDSEKSLSLDDIEMKDDKTEELDDVISTDQFLGKEEVVIAEKRLNLTPVKATSVARADAPYSKRTESNTESISKDKAEGNESKALEDLGSERKKVLQKDSSGTTKTNEKITISYFKSPLNFKGYTYDERNKSITVYGLSQTKSLLITYEEKLYLKNGDNFYLIKPTISYLKFTKVSDANLIKTLKK